MTLPIVLAEKDLNIARGVDIWPVSFVDAALSVEDDSKPTVSVLTI